MEKHHNCKITNKSKLGQALTIYKDRLDRKYPVVIVITGEVGTGKSKSILLNILDYWYKEHKDKVFPKTHLTTELVNYSVALNNAKPLDLVGLDEAIDSFGKGISVRKIVGAFSKMFGICRGRQVATAIVLDDIFRLTTNLAKYVTLWIHTKRRVDNKCLDCGKDFAGEYVCPKCNSKNFRKGLVVYNVYSKSRLRSVLMANENKTVKTIKVKGVRANFQSVINEYRGEHSAYYDELKRLKQSETMEELITEVKIGKRKLKEAEENYKRDTYNINPEDLI